MPATFTTTCMKAPVKFASIVFLQGEPALAVLGLLEQHRIAAAVQCLREHEAGDELPGRDDLEMHRPWGAGDILHRCGHYVLAANLKLQYVSLSKRFSPAASRRGR